MPIVLCIILYLTLRSQLTIRALVNIELAKIKTINPQVVGHLKPALEARKCEKEDSGSAVYFSFRGSVADHKFEGPGKFKHGVVDPDPSLADVCVGLGKILGDKCSVAYKRLQINAIRTLLILVIATIIMSKLCSNFVFDHIPSLYYGGMAKHIFSSESMVTRTSCQIHGQELDWQLPERPPPRPCQD